MFLTNELLLPSAKATCKALYKSLLLGNPIKRFQSFICFHIYLNCHSPILTIMMKIPKMAKMIIDKCPPHGSYPNKSPPPPGQKLECKSPRLGAKGMLSLKISSIIFFLFMTSKCANEFENFA